MEQQQQPVRLMQFISESKLEELKSSRGATIQDGTLAPERPLHEILRENKQKQDKEFKDRFKHQPPKALDPEEMEFLEGIDKVKREHDRQVAKEEALELSNFDAAVAKRMQASQEAAPIPQPKKREAVAGPKRLSHSSILVKVKPLQRPAKKAKVEEGLVEQDSKPGIMAGLVAAYGDADDEDDD
ncbi:uncharacterized protein LOC112342466 [Selaginella moellendorffii]|uniref:uncharacterized protein LOC112342466 n=1 Tax=Selaginella moellendorffii TaxID=88036 RepID=UPI000D1CC2F5|nr:uncharacterized protein LOC112342466 [Selaginella moellendorffii]|eukprot:XP_024520116.1 uncharacterized protein LOC112342466 [Selaginella moellendorffii]